ncbi:MAG: hypothetical protein R3F24_05815 [Gammaproteobacteria bacterium]
MQAVPPTERETSVQVSVRKMSPADTGLLMRSILAMFGELVRVRVSGERLGNGDRKADIHIAKFEHTQNNARVPTFLAG